MTEGFALLVSLVSIAVAIWFVFHSNNIKPKEKKVCAKLRRLQRLERAVKSLAEEMKDA